MVCQVKNVTKSIKGEIILSDISFDIPEASITAIVGPNGAGKTTLMKILVGAVKPDKGTIKILNGSILDAKIRQSVGYIPEHLEFPQRSTPLSYLKQICILNNLNTVEATTKINQYSEIFQFKEILNKRFSNLSAGMKQKIRLALGFMHKNLKFLLMDEPTQNLDAFSRDNLLKIISELVVQTNLSVFYSSHILSEVARLADNLLLLNQGILAGEESNQNKKEIAYSIIVDDVETTVSVLQSEGFKISKSCNKTVLIFLAPNQNTGEMIDLLRRNNVEIKSLKAEPFLKLFQELLKHNST